MLCVWTVGIVTRVWLFEVWLVASRWDSQGLNFEGVECINAK